MASKTALVVFVKYPLPGKVKTRLANSIGVEKAAAVYALFAETCLQRYLSISNVDCIVYYTPAQEKERIIQWLGNDYFYETQPDGDLGQRLTTGFKEYVQRYQKVIALGTDSPDLPAAYIEEATASLEDHDAVIGPCADGGYYLIGMNADHTTLFHNIAWSTNQVVYQTLMKAKESRISVDIMPQWYDVDTQEDLQTLMKNDEVLGIKLHAILNSNQSANTEF